MEIPITNELIKICKEIADKNYSEKQWAEMESDDMFQNNSFCGGFDADENEFCFSYFSPDGNEYWFQIDISSAIQIAEGNKKQITGRVAG